LRYRPISHELLLTLQLTTEENVSSNVHTVDILNTFLPRELC